jgi:hypothetical protein
VLLLSVVHREEGLLGEGCLDASPDRGLVEHDANAESRRHHGLLDLGSPPIGMGKASRGVDLESMAAIDGRQLASWMRQATAMPGFGGKQR